MGSVQNPRKIAAPMVVAIVLVGAAALMDVRVAAWVHARELGPAVRESRIAWWVKRPGDFRFTLVLGAVLIAINRKHWRGAVLMLASGAMGGLLYTLVKWSVGRTRPFPRHVAFVPAFELHPFPLGLRGLWKADNLAFPSGHACLAFATAMALAMLYPRGKWWFFAGALAVGREGGLEGAHYPSDVAGGAMLGIAGTFISAWLLKKVEERQLRRQASAGGAMPDTPTDGDRGNVEGRDGVIPTG